jgi:hypothetical protein
MSCSSPRSTPTTQSSLQTRNYITAEETSCSCLDQLSQNLKNTTAKLPVKTQTKATTTKQNTRAETLSVFPPLQRYILNTSQKMLPLPLVRPKSQRGLSQIFVKASSHVAKREEIESGLPRPIFRSATLLASDPNSSSLKVNANSKSIRVG